MKDQYQTKTTYHRYQQHPKNLLHVYIDRI
nr:MAG TPA: hypothetical protein [Podoviridae sp. ctY3D12]